MLLVVFARLAVQTSKKIPVCRRQLYLKQEWQYTKSPKKLFHHTLDLTNKRIFSETYWREDCPFLVLFWTSKKVRTKSKRKATPYFYTQKLKIILFRSRYLRHDNFILVLVAKILKNWKKKYYLAGIN